MTTTRKPLVSAVATTLLVAATALVACGDTPAGAAAAHAQYPTVSPITYLIDGLFKQYFADDAPIWAQEMWKVDGLAGHVSFAAAPGDNYRYVTAGNAVDCSVNGEAAACADIGCRDNTVSWPDSCVITVVADGTVPWYQGTGSTPSGQQDLWGTLVHEFGHWIGCLHSAFRPGSDGGDHYNTMSNEQGAVQNSMALRSVQQDDINCVRAARLGGSRNIAANSPLNAGRAEWGGLSHLMWQKGGAGGTGVTTGTATWGGYGLGGSGGVRLVAGGGLTGMLNLHQVHSDLGSDPEPPNNSWIKGRPRKFVGAIHESGVSFFFANLIVTEGTAENSSAGPVLANVYCGAVWTGWTTCETPYFTSATGIYTVAVYNGSQQAGNVLTVDDLEVRVQ